MCAPQQALVPTNFKSSAQQLPSSAPQSMRNDSAPDTSLDEKFVAFHEHGSAAADPCVR